MAVLALPSLPAPFTGDQALYWLAGDAILDGEVMYRDFGDIKHPGVHHFYALANLLLGWVGSPELAVHLLELLTWLGFGVFLQRELSRWVGSPWIAAIAPVFTAGAYYVTAGPWMLTQPETLPGLWLGVGIWLVATRTAKPVLYAGGFFLGMAVVFHGHMITIPVGVLLWLAISRRAYAMPLIGFLTCLLVLDLSFRVRGAATELWDVYVTYPYQAWREVPAESQGVERVAGAIGWFVRAYWTWIALAGVALLSRTTRRRPLVQLHAIWIVAGLLTMALETRSSWPFHFLYFVVPVGVLATLALDRLAHLVPTGRVQVATVATIAAVVLLVPMNSIWRTRAVAVAAQVASGASWNSLPAASPHYQTIDETVAVLHEPTSAPGPIHVIGDPLIHLRGDRKQALVPNGWGWEVALERHWGALRPTLIERRPAYVFIGDRYRDLVESNALDVVEWLESEASIHRAPTGTWYQLTHPGAK